MSAKDTLVADFTLTLCYLFRDVFRGGLPSITRSRLQHSAGDSECDGRRLVWSIYFGAVHCGEKEVRPCMTPVTILTD